MASGRVLVYGGKGALGSKCVTYFKKNNFWVASIDTSHNSEAEYSISVCPYDDCCLQESKITQVLQRSLGEQKLNAVICVAGGWAGGNASNNLVNISDDMWRQSVWTSMIAASLAARYLNDGGLLVLTGAKMADKATPGMIGYGAAKSAVHHLVKSLAAVSGGLPKQSSVLGILPVVLDTPKNRKCMPDGDFAQWTPLDYVTKLLYKWTTKKDSRPKSGSLCQLITKENKTQVIPVGSEPSLNIHEAIV